MPKKKPQAPRPIIQEYPDPEDTPFADFDEPADLEPEYSAQDSARTNTHRKKARNVPAQSIASESPPSNPASYETAGQLTRRPPVLASGLPHFAQHNVSYQLEKSRPVNIREELVAPEKVSDQYTPPSDHGLSDEFYGKSPLSNAVSSAANTPPVDPGFSDRRDYQFRIPPLSPPQRSARPLSFGGSIPPLPSRGRTPSTYGSPPPPHMPQPHFYNPGELDLGFTKQQVTGSDEPVFHKIANLQNHVKDVVCGIVSGYESRISISSFDGAGVTEVGSLANTDGLCIDAELLTWSSGQDPFADLRPLLAVTLLRTTSTATGIKQNQLSVSVFSLAKQKHVQDLLTFPSVPGTTYVHGHYAVPAPPVNHVTLTASGNQFVVASGRSGEVFVFKPTLAESTPVFSCVVKLWTSIQLRQKRRDSNFRSVGTEPSLLLNAKIQQSDEVPILALSGNWLALCPPVQSRPALGAVIGENVIIGRQAGTEAASAGLRPAVNCNVDSPDADSLLSKLARGAAQEVMKAGKWLGDQGMQYWQSYWNKEDRSKATSQTPQNQGAFPFSPLTYGQFPPTHADGTQTIGDPETVSLYDLNVRESRKSPIHTPFATFKSPNGCSYLSFAPNGLTLLTASRSGDYQYIWDLMETRFGRAGLMYDREEPETSVPRVRQIARFDRLTGSVIVDVVWDSPGMTRLAILTQNKTVHLFDLPLSASRWPPPRKVKKARPTSAPPTEAHDLQHDAMPQTSFFSSAMSIAGRTHTMIPTLKSRAPSTSGGISGMGQTGIGLATATGAKSGRAVAAGLSKSLGAASEGLSRLQHAGDNRLHITGDRDIGAGRLTWLPHGHRNGVCLLNEEGLRFWQVRRTKSKESRYRETTVFDARKAISYRLATTFDNADWSFWKASSRMPKGISSAHPLSFAEIDTSAPFQPFHTDRRVSLFLYQQEASLDTPKKAKGSSKSNTWVFGDDLPCTKIDLQSIQSFDDDDDATDSVICRQTLIGNAGPGAGEHIVSTTRRKKKREGMGQSLHQQPGDEMTQEGFFEDDCDVLDFANDRV